MIALSQSKKKPTAKLSTAARNDEEYMSSQRHEVADEGDYLRSLAPFIDPYEEVKKSISSRASRASSAIKRGKAGSSQRVYGTEFRDPVAEKLHADRG